MNQTEIKAHYQSASVEISAIFHYLISIENPVQNARVRKIAGWTLNQSIGINSPVELNNQLAIVAAVSGSSVATLVTSANSKYLESLATLPKFLLGRKISKWLVLKIANSVLGLDDLSFYTLMSSSRDGRAILGEILTMVGAYNLLEIYDSQPAGQRSDKN